jgi:hypothetical protein
MLARPGNRASLKGPLVPVKDARDHCGRDDCVAGVVGLELRNPSASHVFEMT